MICFCSQNHLMVLQNPVRTCQTGTESLHPSADPLLQHKQPQASGTTAKTGSAVGTAEHLKTWSTGPGSGFWQENRTSASLNASGSKFKSKQNHSDKPGSEGSTGSGGSEPHSGSSSFQNTTALQNRTGSDPSSSQILNRTQVRFLRPYRTREWIRTRTSSPGVLLTEPEDLISETETKFQKWGSAPGSGPGSGPGSRPGSGPGCLQDL